MSMVNSTSELSIDFNEIGGAVYIKKNGVATESDISILDGKYVGIYFWRPDSPPCREFTKHLNHVYKKYKESKGFEVVFLISENRMYDAYSKDDMPWMAMICNSTNRAALAKKLGVSSVPALAIVSPDRKIIALNARAAVLERPEEFPWAGAVDDEVISNSRMSNYMAVAVLALAFFGILFGLWWFNDMNVETAEYLSQEIARKAKLMGRRSSGLSPNQGSGSDGEL